MNTENIPYKVLDMIRPGPDEQQRMQEVADSIISLVDRAADGMGLTDISGMLVGSAARGTWISGEHDLDIFITFPEDTTEQDLKNLGLDIARKVAGNADMYEERYAEHPYIHAFFNDFEVDLVPCFRVSRAASIKSAVDRTPFHNRFILDRIVGLEDEALLLKQFMKGAGVYGSDLRTGGFSGYLAELLVIHCGTFQKVLEAADTWKPGTTIDILEHGNRKHDDPLVVVDPTDPARNVAAALTLDRFAGFVHASRRYLDEPGVELFFKTAQIPLNDNEFNSIISGRGASLLAVVLDKPDVVDDVLYPQLFMLHSSLSDLLTRNGFRVLGGDTWAGDSEAAVVLELEVWKLPPVKKHTGPPIWEKTHSGKFRDKYLENKGLSGVYIENGRYVVDILRKHTDAADLIQHEIHTCRLGKHVGESIRSDFMVLRDGELLAIGNSVFREFLTGFFHQNPR